MKKKVAWLLLISLITLSLIFAACPAETTPTPTQKTPAPGSPTPTPETHWWDKFGEPQHGGTMNLPTFRIGSLEAGIDPITWMDMSAGWHEPLMAYDWVVDREEFSFRAGWVPDEYMAPNIAESWEWSDPRTLVVNIRKDVYWQDKPPVNGRQFTAQDVVYHWDRLLGTGSGFTEVNPSYAGWTSGFDYVEARDDFTAVFHFKNPTLVNNQWMVYDPVVHKYEAREYVEAGDTTNWRNAVGTGPFLVTDFVAGSKMVLSRNPNYWGHDQRYPESQLPYVDVMNYISIPDIATEIAALRTRKIDLMMEIDWQQAGQLAKTNPEFNQVPVAAWTNPIFFRIDTGYFSDIRVRKALEMAIDRPTIAQSKFGTDGKPCGLVPPLYAGYTLPYDEWPASLQQEYSYNPTMAKQLLTEAGYPNGFNTDIVCSSNTDVELLEIIKSYFMEIGVDMEIRVMDGPAAGAFVNARKHDAMSEGMGGIGAPSLIALENMGIGRDNAVCHEDTNYQAILERFRKAESIDAAKQASVDAVMYILEQHWGIGQVPITTYNVWQPYLKGYSGECGPSFYGNRAWYWSRFWIDQELKESM